MTLLWSCKPSVPSGVIPPDTLEDLLYDYHVAQAMAEIDRDSMDYRRYAYVCAVFDKYDVTEAEFDSTMIWYSSHSVYLNEIYKRLKERFDTNVTLLREATGSKDIYADLGVSGDTANIWHERAFRLLKPRFSEDRMQFVIDVDSSFWRGDDLLWRFEPRHISKVREGDIYAGLYVKYDNDSTAGVTQKVYLNSITQLRLNGDTAHAMKSIGGFVCYRVSDDNKDFRMLILDRIMLIRFHHHYEPALVDSVALHADADSLQSDSAKKFTFTPDSGSHRLSPKEFRDAQPTERSIHVVKEKPYVRRNVSGTRRNSTQRK